MSTSPNLRYSINTNKPTSRDEEEMNKLLNESMKDNYKTIITNNHLIREINNIIGNNNDRNEEIIPKIKYQVELIKSFKIKEEVNYL